MPAPRIVDEGGATEQHPLLLAASAGDCHEAVRLLRRGQIEPEAHHERAHFAQGTEWRFVERLKKEMKA
jgi:hypothetical protein